MARIQFPDKGDLVSAWLPVAVQNSKRKRLCSAFCLPVMDYYTCECLAVCPSIVLPLPCGKVRDWDFNVWDVQLNVRLEYRCVYMFMLGIDENVPELFAPILGYILRAIMSHVSPCCLLYVLIQTPPIDIGSADPCHVHRVPRNCLAGEYPH